MEEPPSLCHFPLPLPLSLPNSLHYKTCEPLSTFSDVTLLTEMEFMPGQDHSGFHLRSSAFPSKQWLAEMLPPEKLQMTWKALMCLWNQKALGCVWVTRSLENPSRRETTSECGQEKIPKSHKWHQPHQRFQCHFTGWSTIKSVTMSLPTLVALCMCYFCLTCLCTRQEKQLISVRRNVKKHFIGGKFHCWVPYAQIFISDSVLFLSSRHLSIWGDHGDAPPLGRYPGESPSSAAVLPPSKAAK